MASYFSCLLKKSNQKKSTPPSPKPPKSDLPGGRRRNSARFFDIQGERASNICAADPPGRLRLRRGWKGGLMGTDRLTQKMNNNHDDFSKYASNPDTWLFAASCHISVWKVLSEHVARLLSEGNYKLEEYSGCREAAMFHAGIAIENALKANIIRQEKSIISGGRVNKMKFGNKSGHGLLELAKSALPEISESEERVIRKLEEYVMWAGKYSVPLKAETLYDRNVKTLLRLTYYSDSEVLETLYNRIVSLASDPKHADL